MKFKTISMYNIIEMAESHLLERWSRADEKADERIEDGIAPDIAREYANKLWAQYRELSDWLEEHKAPALGEVE